jgi:hypothetical protein
MINRRFQFHKRSQLFIRTHNKASNVLALCGHNPKSSALVMRTGDTAATPSGVAGSIGDYIAILIMLNAV